MPWIVALTVFFGFFRKLWDLFKKPKYRVFLVWMVILFAIGTAFYNQIEGWGVLDSLYFCVVTLSNVGYGDLAPTTSAGKIFAMVYMLFGLSMLTSFVSMLAKERQIIHAKRDGNSVNEGD